MAVALRRALLTSAFVSSRGKLCPARPEPASPAGASQPGRGQPAGGALDYWFPVYGCGTHHAIRYGCATHTRREADRLVQIADPGVTCQRLGLRVRSSEWLDRTAWPLRVLRAPAARDADSRPRRCAALLAGAGLGVNSRWPEDSVAGELHRAVPGPVYAPWTECEGPSEVEVRCAVRLVASSVGRTVFAWAA